MSSLFFSKKRLVFTGFMQFLSIQRCHIEKWCSEHVAVLHSRGKHFRYRICTVLSPVFQVFGITSKHKLFISSNSIIFTLKRFLLQVVKVIHSTHISVAKSIFIKLVIRIRRKNIIISFWQLHCYWITES